MSATLQGRVVIMAAVADGNETARGIAYALGVPDDTIVTIIWRLRNRGLIDEPNERQTVVPTERGYAAAVGLLTDEWPDDVGHEGEE